MLDEILIQDSIFESNFANESGVIHANASSALITIDGISVNSNQALYQNSFAGFNNHSNAVQISNSQFERNEVLLGPSLLTLTDCSVNITSTTFEDNIAIELTNVLRLSKNSSTFET